MQPNIFLKALALGVVIFFQTPVFSQSEPLPASQIAPRFFEIHRQKMAAQLQFLRANPSNHLRDSIDESLRTLLHQRPFVSEMEDQLLKARTNTSLIPKTMKAIFEIYAAYGSADLLKKFSKKYPGYRQAFKVEEHQRLIQYGERVLSGKASYDERVGFLLKSPHSRQAWQALLQTIRPDLHAGRWQEAPEGIKIYRMALPFPAPDWESLEKLVATTRSPYAPASLGSALNSREKEFNPVLSPDGRSLFFCRLADQNEDVWVSRLVDSAWAAPRPIVGLNTIYNEAPLSLTLDGNGLYLNVDGVISLSEKTRSGGWSKPLPLKGQVNSAEWQSGAVVSPDRRALIFEAERKEVVGIKEPGGADRRNEDLFVSYLLEDGSWSRPVNLGTTINTFFSERKPFLHPDGKTLYFSSNGHLGLGGLDLFKTTRLDDTWLRWSQPEHLGPSINTPGDDWGFQVSPDGQTAFFASGYDLYQLALPAAGQPEPMTSVSLAITDSEGQPTPNARVLVEDLSDQSIVSELHPDPSNGDLHVPLPIRPELSLLVEKPGAFPESRSLEVQAGKALSDTVALQTLAEMAQKNITRRIENLVFETGSAIINPSSFPQLDRLARLIQQNELPIELAGHTDNVGAEAKNLALSQSRADAVREYFISKGCLGEAIRSAGFGSAQPIASNDTEEGRRLNRRVEIRFLK